MNLNVFFTADRTLCGCFCSLSAKKGFKFQCLRVMSLHKPWNVLKNTEGLIWYFQALYSSRSLNTLNITNSLHIHIRHKLKEKVTIYIFKKYQRTSVFLVLWTHGVKHEPHTSGNGWRSHGVLMWVISYCMDKGFVEKHKGHWLLLRDYLPAQTFDISWKVIFSI